LGRDDVIGERHPWWPTALHNEACLCQAWMLERVRARVIDPSALAGLWS
jgi:hypothetical protein